MLRLEKWLADRLNLYTPDEALDLAQKASDRAVNDYIGLSLLVERDRFDVHRQDLVDCLQARRNNKSVVDVAQKALGRLLVDILKNDERIAASERRDDRTE